MVTRFSDWDYLVFADDFLDFLHVRMLLCERHYPKERALQAVTTNLAHQRAKVLNRPLPEQKGDLVTTIINWDDRTQVFDFAETCVTDIERCDTEFPIRPTLGRQRDILGRKKGGRIRLRCRL